MSKKAMIKLVCLLMGIVVLSGCKSSLEVEQLAIVAGFSVDLNEEDPQKPVLMTFEVMDLGGDASGKSSSVSSTVIQMDGVGVFDAVRNASMKTTNRLYFAHAKVMLIGEEVARKGIAPYLDWVMRDAEPRLTLRLLVTKGSMGATALDTQFPINPVTSFGIDDMVLNDTETLAFIPSVRLYEAFNAIYETGMDLVLPAIEVNPDEIVTNESKAKKQLEAGGETPQDSMGAEGAGGGSGGSGGASGGAQDQGEGGKEDESKKKTHNIAGSAVFRDDRLVGYLNQEQTRYMLYATDGIKGGLLNLPLDDRNQDTMITYEVFKNTTKTSVKKQDDGSFAIELQIKSEVALGEEGPGVFGQLQPFSYEQLQDAASASLESRVAELIKMVQQDYGADVFCFGRKIAQRYPKEWKEIEQDWHELFKTLPVTVSAEVNIRNTGHAHLN